MTKEICLSHVIATFWGNLHTMIGPYRNWRPAPCPQYRSAIQVFWMQTSLWVWMRLSILTVQLLPLPNPSVFLYCTYSLFQEYSLNGHHVYYLRICFLENPTCRRWDASPNWRRHFSKVVITILLDDQYKQYIGEQPSPTYPLCLPPEHNYLV